MATEDGTPSWEPLPDAPHDGLSPEVVEDGLTPETFDEGLWAPHPDSAETGVDGVSAPGAEDALDPLLVDQWAWVHEEPEEPAPLDITHCHVTAVLVTLDAELWLAETLASLARLEPRPERIIAIDNGSVDRTRAILQRGLDLGTLDAVYRGRPGRGFGAAVRQALRLDARAGHVLAGDDDRWLWLLHDDAAPAPDALRRLLEHVVADPSVDVTGPKLLLPGEGRRSVAGPPISEVGVSISGTGRRELMLDAGEVDQGQLDTPRDVLGVSTCGLLVRARVWEEVGGLDPGLPIFRDGVEFGWRCRRLGFRVATTPRAEMTHRQVGRAGLRPRGAAGRRPGKLDRQLGLLVVAANAHRVVLPLVWVRLVWGSLLRALGYLVGKAPGRAADEFRAVAGFAAHPGRIRAVRRRIRARAPVPGSPGIIRRLRPPWWSSFGLFAEAVSGLVTERYRSVAGELDAASLDELTGDDFATLGEEQPRRPWLSPVAITLVLTLLGSLIAARGLFGSGALVSTALLPAPALADLWRTAWQPIPGAPGPGGPPWVALTAAGSTLLAGRPEWFVTALLGLVVPLSLISAYAVLRRTVADRRLRWWAALTYAVLPVLLGGTNQGRLGLCVAALLLPQVALAARAIALRRVRSSEGWRGGWGAGAALAVLLAFEPAFGIVALAAALSAGFALRRAPRKVWRIGLALAVPLVLWAPWWLSLPLSPHGSWGRLLVGPDAGLSPPGGAPAVWALLIGRDTGAGLPPLWLSATLAAVIWVAALAGLARQPRHRLVVTAWAGALLAFATAVVVSRLVVTLPPGGFQARPWTGSLLLVGFGCLLLAAAVGLDGFAVQVSARSFSWLQPTVLLSALVAVAATVGGAAWWMAAGLGGPIQRETLQAVPPYLRNAMAPPDRVRLLAIELRRTQASFAVLYDDQIRLGDADRGFAFGAARDPSQVSRDLVSRLVAGSADEGIASELRSLGIGYVWVRGAGLVDQARIDNTPGLGAASDLGAVVVWPVEGLTTRARVIGADGGVMSAGVSGTHLPAGVAGRELRLAEPVDRRWWATVDGRPLQPVPSGWEQTFLLGEAGGELRYGMHAPTAWLLVVQGVLFIVVLVLAAPAIRRPEVRDPVRAARRAARVLGAPQ